MRLLVAVFATAIGVMLVLTGSPAAGSVILFGAGALVGQMDAQRRNS